MNKAAQYKGGKSGGWWGLRTRLIGVNIFGLLAFLAALLWLGQTRDSLTQAYRQSLSLQAAIMAEALGGLEPIIAEVQTGTAQGASEIKIPVLDVEAARPLLRRLVAPTHNRVRFYDRQGHVLIDTMRLGRNVQIAALDSETELPADWWARLGGGRPPMSDRLAANGLLLEEVLAALDGRVAGLVRQDGQGRDVLTLAVPVQYYRGISGALLVTSPPGTIDGLVAQARRNIIQIFLVVFVIVLGLTILLARTVAEPVRRLAHAMHQIRRDNIAPSPQAVPDYAARRDEIGALSLALRDMLARLRERIDAIEAFAADVAHELKNPLASLNSAVQTLESLDEKTQIKEKAALLKILQADIQRMNKLISDISDASRLDAELGRGQAVDFNLADLLRDTAAAYQDAYKPDFDIAVTAPPKLAVRGQVGRIAQIFNNLLDNARDFAPVGSVVKITASAQGDMAELAVRDSGPGFKPDAVLRIFDRFYTDREGDGFDPDKAWQKHSGLGLSISRQIARAHGGDLRAVNEKQGGACFILTLPLEEQEDNGAT